ncbi:MAG: hypothetical protein AABY22_26100 [Nanoarchaeota archaeon]
MGLLDILQKKGSTLTSNDGVTPPTYNQASVLNAATLVGSQLDLNGTTPASYTGKSVLETASLLGSNLDLDGKTPSKYSDNKPT